MSYDLDKNLENEIISVAKKHGIKKVILFGSRAKETNHEHSDIDLAVQGGNITNFSFDLNNISDTLLSFDVVNLDSDFDENFLSEINRNGIILYEKFSEDMKKFNAFKKSLAVLLKSEREEAVKNEIYRMGVIGQFHLTFELSWKALRELLLYHGVSEAASGSPREIIKAAYKFNFLTDEDIWIDMLKKRNTFTHIYDENFADELVNLIFDKYLTAFVNLQEKIEIRMKEF